jgi:outer membrane murein-binding lipoprotein Lpp
MPIKFVLRIALIGLLILTGCSNGSQSSGAASTVESYLQALVAKDANQMINLSCADWEGQAKVEFDSFAAVELTLEDLTCQEAGQQGSYTLVTCTGTLTASYGTEDLQIDVAERTYQAIEEGGDWRMCG